MSADPAVSAGSRPAATRDECGDGPRIAPIHALVLMALAAAAVFLAAHSASVFHAADAVGKFPPEVRRPIIFGLLFNVVVGLALVLWLAAELVSLVIRAARGARAGRLVLRLLVSCLPLAIFGAGNALLNPWLVDLLRQLRSLAGK